MIETVEIETTEIPGASGTAYSYTEGGRTRGRYHQAADDRPKATVFVMLDGRRLRAQGHHIAETGR